MSLKEFIRKQLLIFVVLVTCISFVMGVSGSIFDSDRRFTYGAYFSPMIYAGLYLLLQFISYSKNELTMKQYIFRSFLQFITYELIVLSFAMFVSKVSISIVLTLAICVPIVEVLASFLLWFLDVHKANALKKELFNYQNLHSKE